MCSFAYLFRICYRPSWEEEKLRQSEKTRKERLSWNESRKPATLPRRRRNLSRDTPLCPTQPSCLFLKLPIELRLRIYRMVFSGSVIHLTNLAKRINHDVIDVMNAGNGLDRVPVERDLIFDQNDRDFHLVHMNHFSKLPLAFLQTCHQIYSEVTPLIYTNNVFSMHSVLPLIYFHDYTLLPQRFSAIRHLDLQWHYQDFPAGSGHPRYPPYDDETWRRFWSVVAEMNLSSLSLWLVIEFSNREHNLDTDPVRPLLKVKGVKQAGIRLMRQVGTGPRTRRLYDLETEVMKQWTSS